jgi:hypothetical protein
MSSNISEPSFVNSLSSVSEGDTQIFYDGSKKQIDFLRQ